MSTGESMKADEMKSTRLSTSGTSLYEILELPKGSTEDDIKKSYRKLALRLHPDKNQNDPNAAEKFKEINRAHSILMDATKKTIYDKYGSFGLNLASQMGEQKAAFFLGMDNKCVKVLLILLFLLTGCCYCFFCYCLCFCKCCCGKFAPKRDEDEDLDMEANLHDIVTNGNPSSSSPVITYGTKEADPASTQHGVNDGYVMS